MFQRQQFAGLLVVLSMTQCMHLHNLFLNEVREAIVGTTNDCYSIHPLSCVAVSDVSSLALIASRLLPGSPYGSHHCRCCRIDFEWECEFESNHDPSHDE